MKLLDKSILIDYIRRGEYEEGAISIITLLEVLRGVRKEKRIKIKELLEEIYETLHIDNNVLLKYCELYDVLKSRGLLIPDADLFIAATAIANNLILVTKDRDFLRLRDYGLKLELRK